jgi:hypothetical protein
MFSPDGMLIDVPSENVDWVLKAGGKRADLLHCPKGEKRWVPEDKLQPTLQRCKQDQAIEYLTSNPRNNGVYMMKDGQVPYEKVRTALKMKLEFTSKDEDFRYHKDYDYDTCHEDEE